MGTPFLSRTQFRVSTNEKAMKMNNDRPEIGTPKRRVKYRGRNFTSACLSCTDLVNCCGRTGFDGASPAKNAKKSGLSRRDLLKIMGGVSAALAVAPFVAGGSYLVPQVPHTFQPSLIAKKSDVPVNGSTVFWFPFTTDPTYTNMLIHLPADLAQKAGSEFVAYNRTCIHLQCLVSYLSNSETIGCPCHGSVYRPTDGWPIGGPAAQIGRYLPNVELKIDGDNIYAVNVNLDDIGYGNTTPPAE
jgi:Rieske Fe-S protein